MAGAAPAAAPFAGEVAGAGEERWNGKNQCLAGVAVGATNAGEGDGSTFFLCERFCAVGGASTAGEAASALPVAGVGVRFAAISVFSGKLSSAGVGEAVGAGEENEIVDGAENCASAVANESDARVSTIVRPGIVFTPQRMRRLSVLTR